MADIGRDLNIEADNNSNDTWASAVEKRIGSVISIEFANLPVKPAN